MAKKLVDEHGQGPFLSIQLDSRWKGVQGPLFQKARNLRDKQVKDPNLTGSQLSLVRSFGRDYLTIQKEFDKLEKEIQTRYSLLPSLSWSAKADDINEYIQAMDAYKKETE